jgi:hypothetical protein
MDPKEEDGRVDPVAELVKSTGAKRLLFACLTHPHQDHFRGLAQLLTRFPPDHLWLSGTYERKFFKYYLEYLKKRGRDGEDAVDMTTGKAFEQLVTTLSALIDGVGPTNGQPRPQYLMDEKMLWSHPIEGKEPVIITSILPSTRGVAMAEADAIRILNGGNSDNKEKGFNPNRISAALLLNWGNSRVLLGGDALQGDAAKYEGWEGLSSSLGKVHLVKVPHHASEGAHSPKLWEQMQPDLAVVTCVRDAARDQPPRPEMLRKLLQTGASVALTARPDWWDTSGHDLESLPKEWPKAPGGKPAGGPGLPKGRTARPAKIENAVVVRLDNRGRIIRVGLHGEARRLNLKGSLASP